MIDQLVIDSCLFFFTLRRGLKRRESCSPAQDLLPVDGVEVDDLVGLGGNNSVIKRSRWRTSGV